MRKPRRPSWWIIGPACLGAGVLIGKALPGLGGQGRSGDPGGLISHRAPIPSLAPIVERAAGAVVGVRAVRVPSESSAGSIATGSGFLVSSDGLLVTSRHVVHGAEEIAIWLGGGMQVRGKLVGEDPVNDLAFVRMVDPPAGLQSLELGNSEDVRAGDWIVSIGCPLGMQRTVTAGVVSFVGRQLASPARVSSDYLQFSAPVNEGSSGSPVLDLDGRVVGVTVRSVEAAQGLSFAVPSRTLKWALESSSRSPDGIVHRGFLGIEFQSRPGENFGEWGAGALVTGVAEGSPAQRCGIRRGDVLWSMDGVEIKDPFDLHERLSRTTPGTVVDLTLLRSGATMENVAVTLEEATEPENEPG